MLAFCVLLPEWRTLSQRESGDGIHDLALTPLKPGLPGIIFEFKWVKGRQGKAIETEAQNAVEQAKEKRYVEELKANGVKRCVAIGIAHNGKRLHVESEWLMT